VVACLPALTAAPGEAGLAGKPDLVVTKATIVSADGSYAVGHGEHVKFTWKHATKNKGKTTAPKSKTGVQFVVTDKSSYKPEGAKLGVPALAPGKSDAGKGAFKLVFDSTWDYGTYPTRVCTDVKHVVVEGKEKNNCEDTHDLYVVPFGFKGTVSGSSIKPNTLPGVTLSWQFPAGVSFELNSFATVPGADNGLLAYHYVDTQPSTGDLSYSISGTNAFDGCTWSGSGTVEPNEQYRSFDATFGYGYAWFAAQIPLENGTSSYHFPATVTCPNGTPSTVDVYPTQWSAATWWFNTNGPQDFADRGVTALDGTYTSTTGTSFSTTWTWHLVPYDFPGFG
jgi:hypothetical protein